jgi:hypothetical protein
MLRRIPGFRAPSSHTPTIPGVPQRGVWWCEPPPRACYKLDGLQVEPGGRRTEIALQRILSDRRAPSTLAVGDEPPMDSQVPSAPGSSLCPENAEGQRSRWLVRIYFADLRASLACATTLRRGVHPTECSMSSYPVHRSLPPTRRSSSDERIVPTEA